MHEFADSESRIEVVDWVRGSEADAEECVDRGEIPFGRSGPACRQGVDSGDGGRRVEVVHECGAQPIEDAGGSRRASAGGPGAPACQTPLRFGEEIVRPLPVVAVALGEHSEPDRPRVDAGVYERGHEHEVAAGLAHLLAAVGHEPSVRVQVRERAPGQRSRMARAELVVREHEVGTTAVHRDWHVEELLRDDRALDVPARPACAEHGLPARLTVARAAPEQRVEDVALARPLRVAAALREELEHGRAVEVALLAEVPWRGGRGRSDVEVDVVLDPVCGAAVEEAAQGIRNLLDHLGRRDVVVGWNDAEALHVATEQLGLLGGEGAPVDAGRRCALEKRVVDVRRVLDVAHSVAGVEPETDEGVVGEVGCGVADVGGVVWRYAAHIQAGDSDRPRLNELSRRRVVDVRNGPMPWQPWNHGTAPGSHRTSLPVQDGLFRLTRLGTVAATYRSCGIAGTLAVADGLFPTASKPWCPQEFRLLAYRLG